MAALATMALAVLAACGGTDTGLEISDARIGQPTGPNAAMYFTASSHGSPDRMVSASTNAAAAAEAHETTMNDDGIMSMHQIEALDVPADGSLVLEPRGYHLMLVDARRMEVGEKIEVTLVWERAGEMTVTAEVVDPANTMGHDS